MKIKDLRKAVTLALFATALLVSGGSAAGFQEFNQAAKLRLAGPPKQISPADGAVLTNFPRRLALRWTRLNISRDTLYEVEIDCLHCTQVGKWDSEVGNSKIISNLLANNASYLFPGDNKGRWRVRAKFGSSYTAWSPWWHFSFKTVPAPAEKSNICIDNVLRIGNKTTPWGSNYTVTLTPLDAISTSAGKGAFRVEYYIKNCKGPATGTFGNRVFYNNSLVAQQTGLTLGAAGDVRQIKFNVQLPLVSGVFKIKLDAGNTVDEDWENDNEVWVNVQFDKK